MSWTPQQAELRDRLLEELAYITGEPTGGRISAECTLKVLHILEELGWTTTPCDASPRNPTSATCRSGS